MLNQNSTIPLYEQVKEAIKLKIEQKEWKENTRVPSETELMKIYEVSRVTVRNALALLVDEGYLEKKQGIGTFVSKPRIKKIIFHRASFTQSCAGAGLVPGTQVLKKEVVEGKNSYRKSLQLEADDPGLLMKFTLLVQAGMTVRNAFRKMAADYKRKKESGSDF